MKKQTIGKDLLIISILTTISVAVWIAVDIYGALHKSDIPQVLKKQIEPLNPKLDTLILEQLESREFFDLKEESMSPPSPTLETLPANPESEILSPEPLRPEE